MLWTSYVLSIENQLDYRCTDAGLSLAYALLEKCPPASIILNEEAANQAKQENIPVSRFGEIPVEGLTKPLSLFPIEFAPSGPRSN